MKSLLLLSFMPFILSFVRPSWASNNVTYIGHATILIESNGARILTDPFFGNIILGGLKRQISPACKVEELPAINMVLVSHTHPDHFDKGAIASLKGNPKVIMPWGRGKELKEFGVTVIELKPWQMYKGEKIIITAIPAKHMAGHCLGYLIEFEHKKIYYTGDTKYFSGLERLEEQQIDIMLLPYGGNSLLGSIWTTEEASQAVKIVNPKVFIPIHWGTFKRWWTSKEPESPEEFLQIVKKRAPSIQGKVLRIGERIEEGRVLK